MKKDSTGVSYSSKSRIKCYVPKFVLEKDAAKIQYPVGEDLVKVAEPQIVEANSSLKLVIKDDGVMPNREALKVTGMEKS